MNILKRLTRFFGNEDGPTTVEYAVMLALIFGVIAATVAVVGTETNDLYSDMSTEVNEAITDS